MPSTLLNKSDPANFSLEDWVSIAEDLEIQSDLFINGSYVSACLLYTSDAADE